MSDETQRHGPGGNLMDGPRCQATSKRSGQRCKRLASRGSRVCARARSLAIEKQAAAVRAIQRRRSTNPEEVQKNVADLAEALNTLWTLIDSAAEDGQVWEDIDRAVARLTALGRYEQDRLVRMNQVVSTEQALGLFNELVIIVRENVSDRDALRRIQEGMTRVIGDGSPGRIG
jgi:hypothetical protein